MCCGTGSPGRKEVLDDVGEGHLPPLTKGGHERSPVAALVCSEHFSEAPNILRKLLLAQILLLHRRLRGWESLASQNLEVCLPRSRTKSKWGSQRLGVARERAQHVCPLHTHGGNFLSCKENETTQNPASGWLRGLWEVIQEQTPNTVSGKGLWNLNSWKIYTICHPLTPHS